MDGGSSPTESTTTGELSCEQLPAEANCPGPAPPKPVPMSPHGPVPVFKSEYWAPEETDSDNGVYEVARTARGTFAETGIVHDVRPGHDEPIEGASVTYESVDGPHLTAPPGGHVRVTTHTGYGGAYAFIDMPVAKTGTCYRLVITAPALGTYEAVDVSQPGMYDHSGLELDGATHSESYIETTRGKAVPRLWKACAAQASR
jgi:hypothetical protein